MKIDMVLPYSVGGPSTGVAGTARVLFDLAAGFSARGHRTTIWARADGQSPPNERARGFLIERISELRVPSFIGSFMAERFDAPFLLPLLVRNATQPSEVVMAFNDPWPCLMQRASYRVFTLHIPNPHLTPKNRLLQALIKADVTICCSRFVAERVGRYAPRIAKRITYVPNGIDPTPFESASGVALRKSLGVDAGDVLLLYAGQINPLKGLAFLISALRKARLEFSGLKLAVIGSSMLWPTYNRKMTERALSYEDKIRRMASDLPVHFAGLVSESEKPSYFAAADVFVCPSVWNEPFGLTNLEAMAAGRPVVASRVGGIPEVVEDGETGILVPPGDPSAMSEAILTLARDGVLRQTMGSSGRNLVKKKFSLEGMVEGYIRLMH